MLGPQLFTQFATRQVVNGAQVICDKSWVNSCGLSIVWHNNIERFGARAQVGVSPTSVLCGAMSYGNQIVGQACCHNKIGMWGI